jgi:hypothetical protein
MYLSPWEPSRSIKKSEFEKKPTRKGKVLELSLLRARQFRIEISDLVCRARLDSLEVLHRPDPARGGHIKTAGDSRVIRARHVDIVPMLGEV